VKRWFNQFATKAATASGHWAAFGLACLLIISWMVSGPFLGYSEIWMLLINTVTTIVTFLMVFLIQNTQNRDLETMRRELDELVRAVPEADETVAEDP
jgi:low affinity Fe/Cu permease